MKSLAYKLLGQRLVKRSSLSRSSILKSLDPKKGFAMMLDLKVPISRKLVAAACGIAIIAVLEFIEVPLALAALLIPGGIAFDFLLEGSEAIVGPMLIACAILPLLVESAPANRQTIESAPVL